MSTPEESEKNRLDAVNRLHLLDTPHEERFAIIPRVAVRLFNVPISAFSVVAENKVLYKAGVGLKREEIERSLSICSHALHTEDILIIEDTRADPVFSQLPAVKEEKPPVLFYTGIPIRSAEKQPIGTLCLKGHEPRPFSPEDRELLRGLAQWIELLLNQYDLEQALQFKGSLSSGNTGQQENFFSAILNSSHDAIISKTLEGTITTWNKAAERMYGYTAGETIGKSVKMLIPQEVNDFEVLMESLREGKEIVDFETRRICKNGDLLDVSLSIAPIFSAEKKPIGATVIARNITQQKENEKKLQTSLSELEQFNKILVDRELKMIELKKEIERLTQHRP